MLYVSLNNKLEWVMLYSSTALSSQVLCVAVCNDYHTSEYSVSFQYETIVHIWVKCVYSQDININSQISKYHCRVVKSEQNISDYISLLVQTNYIWFSLCKLEMLDATTSI